MWRRILFGGLLALAVFRASLRIFGQAGNPSGSRTNKRDDSIQTLEDLRREVGGKLPSDVEDVFAKAVENQLRQDYAAAWREYDRLRRIPQVAGGTFDLTRRSNVVANNLRQLMKKMFPDSE